MDITDITNPIVEGINCEIEQAKQKIEELKAKLKEIQDLLKNQEDAFESMIKHRGDLEVLLGENIKKLASKKANFEHTGVLMKAIEEITSDSETLLQSQLAEFDTIKESCKTEYNDNVEEEGSIRAMLEKLTATVTDLAARVKDAMIGGMSE